MNAKKTPLKQQEALALARGVNEIYAAKRKSVIHVNMKRDKPDKETLTKLLLGPTGNLRAPTLRVGKTLIVGFNKEIYHKIFG